MLPTSSARCGLSPKGSKTPYLASLLYPSSEDYCAEGISHNPDEWSSQQDCVAGANVLYPTVLELTGA